MVLEVLKKILVLLVVMMHVKLWSNLKDLLLMVLLLILEDPVLVMLNTVKLVIMVVVVGKILRLLLKTFLLLMVMIIEEPKLKLDLVQIVRNGPHKHHMDILELQITIQPLDLVTTITAEIPMENQEYGVILQIQIVDGSFVIQYLQLILMLALIMKLLSRMLRPLEKLLSLVVKKHIKLISIVNKLVEKLLSITAKPQNCQLSILNKLLEKMPIKPHKLIY
jgi:hypothetical protein